MATPVATAQDLYNIRNNLAGEYVQVADIDLSGYANWEPIGSEGTPFTGIYDGNGYKITGLTISRSDMDNVGLFGVCVFNTLEGQPRLRNITIEGASVGRDNVGALAGKLVTDKYNGNVDGSGTGFDLVVNCSSSGTVSGRNNVGGLIGLAEGPVLAGHSGVELDSWNIATAYVVKWALGRITRCTSSAAVSATGSNVGGLVGRVNELRLSKCHASGTVSSGDICGGLAGYIRRGHADGCLATGTVTGSYVVGGLIGLLQYRSKLEECCAEGGVSATGELASPSPSASQLLGAGGLVGSADGADQLKECCASGNVTGRYRVGGLVGSWTGGQFCVPNITDCCALGNVEATGSVAGGLIGWVFPYLLEIACVFVAGSVTGADRGAIVGQNGALFVETGSDEDYAICWQNPSLFDATKNDAPTTLGGEGKTTAELGQVETYAEWGGFDHNWALDPDESPYPILRAFYDPARVAISAAYTSAGLVLAYSAEGKAYYRLRSGGVWGEPMELGIPGDVHIISVAPTLDGRTVFVADPDGKLYWILPEQNSMTPVRQESFGIDGSYGNFVHLPDGRVRVYFVSPVGTVSALSGELQDGWETLTFSKPEPVPSDSYVSRLRAHQLGEETVAVWRSRGQHRAAEYSGQDSEIEAVRVSGTVTLQLGNPVVQATLEVFDGDAVTCTVTFVVTDAAGTPLEGAIVVLGAQRAVIDAAGVAQVQVIPYRTYSWSVAKNGYEAKAGRVTVTDNVTVTVILDTQVCEAALVAPTASVEALAVVEFERAFALAGAAACISALAELYGAEVPTLEKSLALSGITALLPAPVTSVSAVQPEYVLAAVLATLAGPTVEVAAFALVETARTLTGVAGTTSVQVEVL